MNVMFNKKSGSSAVICFDTSLSIFYIEYAL